MGRGCSWSTNLPECQDGFLNFWWCLKKILSGCCIRSWCEAAEPECTQVLFATVGAPSCLNRAPFHFLSVCLYKKKIKKSEVSIKKEWRAGGNGAGLEQLRVGPLSVPWKPFPGDQGRRAGIGICSVSLLLLTNLGMLFHALGCRAAEQNLPGRQGRSLSLL